jgi:hypothetical protein
LTWATISRGPQLVFAFPPARCWCGFSPAAMRGGQRPLPTWGRACPSRDAGPAAAPARATAWAGGSAQRAGLPRLAYAYASARARMNRCSSSTVNKCVLRGPRPAGKSSPRRTAFRMALPVWKRRWAAASSVVTYARRSPTGAEPLSPATRLVFAIAEFSASSIPSPHVRRLIVTQLGSHEAEERLRKSEIGRKEWTRRGEARRSQSGHATATLTRFLSGRALRSLLCLRDDVAQCSVGEPTTTSSTQPLRHAPNGGPMVVTELLRATRHAPFRRAVRAAGHCEVLHSQHWGHSVLGYESPTEFERSAPRGESAA